jgi:long-subunit acyl-CoA synthetase (AMP-forming)
MLFENHMRFGSKIVFQERNGDIYEGISWDEFYSKIENVACNLQRFGYLSGDKVLIFSQNRIEMLLLELAVMSSGGVCVPIFFNYNQATAESLIQHSDAKFIAVGNGTQLNKINPDLNINGIFVFDDIFDNRYKNLTKFSELLREKEDPSFRLKFEAKAEEVCLNMYTSGTMGRQKCVQLTHRNILSQQAALKEIWNIDENDRFLSFLRWHHSFGGIFEKFSALYNGALLSLESSQGLNPSVIMENWNLVKPTVFFSVPMIYHQLVDLTRKNKELKKSFFHRDLKFVFTAAAPLPQYISNEFETRKIQVIEGWGLTETSPCCTLTDPKLKREPGVIGKPIPGISIRLADDGEMQVNGPNVMAGYYKNDEANASSFTEDGWFCTGDIGEYTENGFKLITRKDRIFKLSNAEKIIPTELEGILTGRCPYISYALVEGSGKDYPVALLFPDKMLLNGSVENTAIEIDHCDCPKNLNELSSCLKGCLINVNNGLKQKFARIKSAMLIDDELKVDNSTLTPSLKLSPANVNKIYKSYIEKLYGSDKQIYGTAYIISLDDE